MREKIAKFCQGIAIRAAEIAQRLSGIALAQVDQSLGLASARLHRAVLTFCGNRPEPMTVPPPLSRTAAAR